MIKFRAPKEIVKNIDPNLDILIMYESWLKMCGKKTAENYLNNLEKSEE